MSFIHTPDKSWSRRIIDWTFGPAPMSSSGNDRTGQSLFNPHDRPDEPDFSRVQQPEPENVPVWVEQKARSALEAFKDAITDGTRLFCEQNVHPLYVLDQRTKYRVTGIQVFVPRDKSSFLQPLEKLPIEVRNRMARILVMAAPGAQEQLVIDDGFFGISLDVEPTVIDGQTIRLIASWSIDSAEIKLVFSGQYISVDPKPVAPAVDVAKAVVISPQPQEVPSVIVAASGGDVDEPTTPLEPELTRETTARLATNETPLGLTRTSAPHGTDTPLTKPSSRQIALVRIQYAGQDQETTVAITQDMLPFVIGREHTSSGRFQYGFSLGDAKDSNMGMLVSREHLELNKFFPETSTFYFVNHGHARNGSFHQGCALSERFMLKAMAPGNVIHLGGSGGVGTVRVIVEAV